MNHADIDPSLCSGDRPFESLDDGFSPPDLRTMNHTTPVHHPVEPEPEGHDSDDAAPNSTQLPIEPEFGPMLPPGEPDEPGVTAPHL